ncbi:MAG: alpha-amylase family glycosyl hydrolase [Nannocystaceae bacterium]
MGDRGTIAGRRGRGGRGVGLSALAGLLAVACSNDHPQRSCASEVWAQPQRPGAALSVVGSWDGWLLPGRPLRQVGDEGWQRVVIDDLAAGEYGYLILEDGADGRMDELNPLSLFWAEQGDLEVSRLEVGDCGAPALEIAEVRVDEGGGLEVDARFLAAQGGGPVADVAVALDGAELPAASVEVEPASGSIRVRVGGLAQGKHGLVIDARAAEDERPASARAVGWVRPRSSTWEGGTLYHVVIDRFRGDGGAPLDPPADPGGRAGGTLDGVRAAIEGGALDRLGVTALWLSPVYLGPEAARLGRDDDHLYTNYHGYWVEDGRAVEPQIGSEEALRRLVASAHSRGIKVLLDVVPNHIYEDNPWAAELAASGGLNVRDPLCICGAEDCSWGAWIQTCWFTDYLPDLRLKDAEVMARVVADAVWWTTTFDLDGVRVDAVPMMPRAATRRIAAGIRASAAPRGAFFLLGEVFTGPGAWGIDAIRYYLGPDGIDSVFDFPLMWTIRDVVAHRSVGFEALEAMLAATEAAIAGSGAVLGRFIGNHDTSRFASESAGDLGEGVDPWVDPPPQPTAPEVYERQAIALGLTLTLPGLAVLYYGDEVGLAGGDDPDCRRVMPGDDALTPAQRALRASAERLGQLRRCLPVMASDVRRTLVADGDLYAFTRDDGVDAPLVVVINRGDAPASPVIDLGASAWAGEFVDVLSGERLALGEGPTPVAAPARSIQALVPAASPCAADPGTSDP